MREIVAGAYDAVVIGTGAAGYNAACRIKELGTKSVCMVTEGKNCGTSRNTGSDKQTYYKLGLGGSAPDSVRNMADNLFAGGCVDGDNALCEAALSARCFYNLCEAGVPFPCNRYGEFVGYKTDHDPYARATSAGPLTSKFMTEVLERKAEALEIEVYDHMLAVEVLTDQNGVCGLLCLDRTENRFVVFSCANIVLATGGPAGIYADSVYPTSHRGSTGLALRAGASLQNMTEWQYGLASVAPRWNVSGTYMQVLPRFVSIDEKGEEREFLAEFFADKYDALSKVFLKGYQWPFDAKKAYDGSSEIDLLVYRETVLRKRRVYLDFMKNPFGLEQLDYERLSAEAFGYLSAAEACFGTPIKRLQKMNAPAIELYASKGVDLRKDYLEIALCAQHNNGGIAVDAWWQTSVPGLFAAGECAGTHGITRPGGSALNAGQVGSLRAAQFISASNRAVDFGQAASQAAGAGKGTEEIIRAAVLRHEKLLAGALKNSDNVDEALKKVRQRMSDCGGAIRDIRKMRAAYDEVHSELMQFSSLFGVGSKLELVKLYRLWDALTVQLATLGAMIDYAENVKVSRGSALYYAFVSAMFGMRCLPWFRTMKAALPAIGTIRLLNGQKSYKLRTRPDYYKKQETFGGIIPWVAIHALDWIYAMTGLSVSRIDALTNNEYNRDHGDLEMTSLCMFELEGGVLASVSADFYRPVPAKTHGDDRLRIVGTEGVLESIGGVVKLIDKDGERELTLLAAEDVFEQFLRRTKGENVGVSSEDSFYMTEVALKAEAMALGKREIFT